MDWLGDVETRRVYGIKEIALALGSRPQTVAQWNLRGHLPPPDAELACGPVWLGIDVGRFDRWVTWQLFHRLPAVEGLDSLEYATAFGILDRVCEALAREGRPPLIAALAVHARLASRFVSETTWQRVILDKFPGLADSVEWALEELADDGDEEIFPLWWLHDGETA